MSYDGKRVVITGAHSGIGAATAQHLLAAGAEVTALDIKPVEASGAHFIATDMGDPAAIDAAVAEIGEPVHRLFNCAGIPQTFPALDVMRVNFLGLRHLTEALLPRMPAGNAVAHVASVAGIGWTQHLEAIRELVATQSFDEGLAWCEKQGDLVGDGYFFSKECVIVYTLLRSKATIQDGIRMNCCSPGPVDSPMMGEFKKVMDAGVMDWTVQQGCGRMARPEEMAPPLIFLNSNEASYVNGHNLIADGGISAALATGQIGTTG